MKVLHIIGGGDIGGAKVHVLSLVKELGMHIDVKIISLRPGLFAEDAQKMGIKVEVVKSNNIISDIKRVIEIVNNEGYEILHSHGAKANLFALAVKVSSKIPVVTTVHSDYKLDYMHSFIKKMTLGVINTIALRYMDYYIGVSSTFKKMLVDRNFSSDKIFTLYNGMDFHKPVKKYTREFLSDKYKLTLKTEDILVGIAARLYPVKGIDTLIEAAATVIVSNPLVKFLIGGDGEDRRMLEEKVRSLNIQNNVFFLGWLEDPYELMSVVDISVLTSISESFPYSILEGAMFMKATVSSRVGGIPDLIEDGINGFLFEPGDKKVLANKLLELAYAPQKRHEFGKKIFDKASSQFSLKTMCNTQLGIYSDIIALTKTSNWRLSTSHKDDYLNSVYSNSKTSKFNNKTIDIILSGYYGFQNVGDDAMLKAIIENLRKYKPDVRIIVLSRKPKQTAIDYNVVSISRVNIIRIAFLMRKARLFVYGGGNIIQDNTSTRSLMYYLATTWMAKHMGLKIMFYSNGIGPINKSANIAKTSKILNKADVITVREELSLNELKKMKITSPKIVLSADAALSISFHGVDDDVDSSVDNRVDISVDSSVESSVDSSKLFRKLGIDTEGPFIGFSVRRCPGCENHEHTNYEKVIAQAADFAFENYGLKSVFIPMQYPIDSLVIDKIIRMMKNKAFVVKDICSVTETLTLIEKLDIMIAMRLHALVFAAIMGVPLSGIIYEPKVEGFLQYLGENSPELLARNSIGYVKDLSFDSLKKEIDYLWNNKASISKEMKNRVKYLHGKAEESAKIAIELLTSKD